MATAKKRSPRKGSSTIAKIDAAAQKCVATAMYVSAIAAVPSKDKSITKKTPAQKQSAARQAVAKHNAAVSEFNSLLSRVKCFEPRATPRKKAAFQPKRMTDREQKAAISHLKQMEREGLTRKFKVPARRR